MDNRILVTICCPAKVGSTSLVSSLRLSACDKLFVLHTHGNTIFSGIMNGLNLNVSDVVKNASVRQVVLIDIYRTPVEQKISEFFHEIGTLHFNNKDENILNYSNEKITKRLLQCWNFLAIEDYYESMFINYGATPIPDNYDWEKTPFYYSSKGNLHFLKLRLQDSHLWNVVLTELFKTPITIVRDFETATRGVGELYKRFCSSFKLPPERFYDLLNLLKLDKYLTINERNAYLNKWMLRQGSIIDTPIPFNNTEWSFYNNLSNDNQYYKRELVRHYLDDGCLCSACIEQRRKSLFFALTTDIKIPVYHTELSKEKSVNVMNINIYPDENESEFYVVTVDVQV